MQLAAELVLQRRDSVARIAEAVGYQSERAFRELFIRHFGMPPRDYAKHHAEEREQI
ncbi:Helix-turn-helix domain protein [compost metagenome]